MKRKAPSIVSMTIICLLLHGASAPKADEVADLIFSELLEVENDTGRLGDYGRLIIPEVGVNVAVFYTEDNFDNEAQVITDAWDSAVYMPWVGDQAMIADHWTQGFINIKDCREGTRAYIKREDSIEMYVCTEMATGNNLVYSFLINTQKDHVYKTFDVDVSGTESVTESITEGLSETVLEETRYEQEPGTEGQNPWDDPSYYTTPHEWTGYYELEAVEGETTHETETEIFWGQPLEYIDDYDLFMYTCNGRWRDVFIALFTLEEVFPVY